MPAISCKKDVYETGRTPGGPEYFNMKTGSWSVYSVYEVLYDDFTNSTDTLIYQLKEHNESQYKDNLGRNAMRIDRYIRSKDSTPWQYLNTWYASADKYSAERVEDNSRIIKLSFPLSEEAVWDANALNSGSSSMVFYGLINRPYTLDSTRFASVVSVEGSNYSSSGKERAFREIYAKGIGLIYRNYVQIDTDITGKLKRGIRQNLKLIQHAD